MTREELLEKKLPELRELAKEAGIKSIVKYRKAELCDLILERSKAPQKKPAGRKAAKAKVEPTVSAKPEPAAEVAPVEPPPSKPETPARESLPAEEPKAKPKETFQGRSDSAPTKGEYIPRKMRNEYQPRTPYQQRHNSYYHGNSHERTDKIEFRSPDPDVLAQSREALGILEIMSEGYGFLRVNNYFAGQNDIYVAPAQIRRFGLRNGDQVFGRVRKQREGDRFEALMAVDKVNGKTAEDGPKRIRFEDLTPIFPEERYTLEVSGRANNLAVRLIDLIAPIGKGQRAMIVSQPKAGKTTLLKQIANGISDNYPEAHLIILLIDERPEEVTDIQRSTRGEVVFSTFDELPEHHTRIAEMVHERAMRLVEMGKDVVVLLDSLTRLTRAYNLVIPPTGRTLSGGMDPGALHKPKRFFGAARNIEGGGSLTVIATALVETGSRMDDIVYEEFKGTGNMEIHLDRRLAEKRIFPAIDIYKSGTRRDDLLLSKKELDGVHMMRKTLASGGNGEVTEQFISMMSKTNNNEDFLQRFKEWVMIYEKSGYIAGSSQNRYGQ
ncbi:MAG: transcription termination factor Rho [Clostridia bacterium]|nr:transcription termination factor Rho [Clostridia bacterium]